ncbi:glycosyltransferase family 4 protein [Bacillus tianshenii]|nr:glycosyltransferase family 4 protein [Bacillus tianshenii]
MKVCVLSSVHPIFDVRIFHKEVKSLLKNGYEVSYIIQHEKDENIDGVRVIALPRPKDRLNRITKLTWKCYRMAIKEDADVYHFHDPELIPIGILLRLKGKKVIYDIHENVAGQILNKKWLPFRKLVSFLYRMFELTVCHLFYIILAEDSYNKLYKNFHKKITVKNFPDINLFPIPKKPFSKDYIVYLGSVSEVRGIFIILEALAILKERNIHIQFKCIGNYTEECFKKIEQQCERLGIQELVQFYGRLNAPDAYKIVEGAKLGLAVLKPIPNYMESYPTKIFEYMALKVPVITSNFPLYKKVINESRAGMTVEPNNVTEVASAIEQIVLNPQEAIQMGENGRNSVEEKYNWELESSKLIDLYKKIETTL